MVHLEHRVKQEPLVQAGQKVLLEQVELQVSTVLMDLLEQAELQGLKEHQVQQERQEQVDHRVLLVLVYLPAEQQVLYWLRHLMQTMTTTG
jgi:hypothetical protein